MSVYSDALKEMTQQYINGDRGIGERLKTALKSTSANTVYCLVKDVRGKELLEGSLFHRSAQNNDVEMLECLLEDFSADQLRETWNLSSYSSGTRTAFHHAAWTGSVSALTYLLKRTSTDAIFGYLSKKDHVGDTALHDAANKNHVQAIQVLLSSVSPQQQISLLKITNNADQSVADILSSMYPQAQLTSEKFTAISALTTSATMDARHDKAGGKNRNELKRIKKETEQSMQATAERLEVEVTEKQDRIDRKQAEMNRKQVEMDRKQVEMDRKQVEMNRKQVEVDRKQVEIDRRQLEMDRKQVEIDRKLVEMDGKQVETDEKLARLDVYLRETIDTNRVGDQENPDDA